MKYFNILHKLHNNYSKTIHSYSRKYKMQVELVSNFNIFVNFGLRDFFFVLVIVNEGNMFYYKTFWISNFLNEKLK